jgi:hypothetical protein
MVPITDCKEGAGLVGLLLALNRVSDASNLCSFVTDLIVLNLAPHRFYPFHDSVDVHLYVLTER